MLVLRILALEVLHKLLAAVEDFAEDETLNFGDNVPDLCMSLEMWVIWDSYIEPVVIIRDVFKYCDTARHFDAP